MEDQESGRYEKESEGENRWTARDRTVIAKMEQYLNKNDNMMVESEELVLLLGTEDTEVDLAGSSKFSARKVRVSTWLPAECDEMSVKGYGRPWTKRQEGRCKKLTTKSIKIRQQSTERLQREC